MTGRAPSGAAPARAARGPQRRSLLHKVLVTLLAPLVVGLFFWAQQGGGPRVLGLTYALAFAITVVIQVCLGLAEAFVAPRLRLADGEGPASMVRNVAFYAGVAAVGTLLGVLALRATVIPDLFGSARAVVLLVVYFLLFLGLSLAVTLGSLLWRRLEERVRADQDMKLARRIQSSFLPVTFALPPAYDLHAINVPSRQVSGDFYDVVPAGDGALLLAIADVSGKGVPAALLGAMLQASLRVQAATTASVAAIVAGINRLLLQQQSVGRFATFFLARLDAACGRLVYCNAGHNPPLLWRRGGQVDALEEGGTVVGILPDPCWREAAVELAPGDRLVLYTDGITEAAGPAGELFGEQRLRAVLGALPPGLASREAAARVIAAVDAFTGGADPDDDRTLMLVRVAAEPAA